MARGATSRRGRDSWQSLFPPRSSRVHQSSATSGTAHVPTSLDRRDRVIAREQKEIASRDDMIARLTKCSLLDGERSRNNGATIDNNLSQSSEDYTEGFTQSDSVDSSRRRFIRRDGLAAKDESAEDDDPRAIPKHDDNNVVLVISAHA